MPSGSKLRTNCILLVKYRDWDKTKGEFWEKWVELRANKGKDLYQIQQYFSNKGTYFRFLYIYEYHRLGKGKGHRGLKVGYIDRNRIEY